MKVIYNRKDKFIEINDARKLFSIVVLLFMGVAAVNMFGSCNHYDYYYEEDLPPVLTLTNTLGRTVYAGGDNVLTDTVKVGAKINLGYTCYDTHEIEPEVFVENAEESYECSIVDDKLAIVIKREGLSRGTVIGRDIYGKRSQLDFVLTAFSNKPPVASCSVKKVSNLSDYEINIDMSKSYDTDSEFGGRIAKYEYTITNSKGAVYSVQTELSNISYIFKEGGLQKIQCRVCDNDGVWSDWVTEYVEF